MDLVDVGGLAQLGEHLLCKQGVIGSIPFTSTTFFLSLCIKDVGLGDAAIARPP